MYEIRKRFAEFLSEEKRFLESLNRGMGLLKPVVEERGESGEEKMYKIMKRKEEIENTLSELDPLLSEKWTRR